MARRFAISSRRVVVDRRLQPATIIVDDGLIEEVVKPDQAPPSIESIDFGDDIIMAGLIDGHVHINEPGRTDWEGFETATRAAAAGGITTVVDMPLNSTPVTTTVANLQQKRRAADDKLWVDTGFYAGLVPGNEEHIVPLLDAGVLGVKAFLCHSGIDDFPNVTRRELQAVMPLLAGRDKPLLVHAERVDDIAPIEDEDAHRYAAYLASRPPRFEIRAIEMLIDLCRQTDCPVHIVHLATAEAVSMLRQARTDGLPITVETCPHYLTFAAQAIPDADPLFKCAPPLRDEDNRRGLLDALDEGIIDLVATDHSPSPPELKELESGDLRRAWGGISSLQLLLPALWTATSTHGATPVDIARWTGEAPAKLLRKDHLIGTIAPERRANLVVWDPDASFVVNAEQLHHRHQITPYDGERLRGVVRATFLRGRKIFDGTHLSANPHGQQITSISSAPREDQ